MENVNCRLFISSTVLLAQASPVTGSGFTWNWSGSANVNGQSAISYSQTNLTVNAGTWYTLVTQSASQQLKSSGDSAITYLQDVSSNRAYQIVHIANSNTNNGTISIQRIA